MIEVGLYTGLDGGVRLGRHVVATQLSVISSMRAGHAGSDRYVGQRPESQTSASGDANKRQILGLVGISPT
jgi:hypothetical protein